MTRIWVLLGAVLVLGIVALIAWWPQLFEDTDPYRLPARVESGEALPAVDRNRVAAIEIWDADDKVRLARSGDHWVMPDRFDSRATERLTTQLLDGLKDVGQSELVGSNPARHSLFEVAEGEGRFLKLEDGDGQTLLEIQVGKMDNSRGPQAPGTFVRPAGSDAVFRHPGRLIHLLHTQPKIWLEKRLSDVPPQEANELIKSVSKIELEFDDVAFGPLPGQPDNVPPGEQPETPESPERYRVVMECIEVPKEEIEDSETVGPDPSNPRRPPGEDPDATTVRQWRLVDPEPATETDAEVYPSYPDSMTRMLLSGQWDDVVGNDPANPEYGLDEPVLSVRVTWEDATTRQLRIGKQVPGEEGAPAGAAKYRYAHVEGSPLVVQIREHMLNQWKKKPAELKPPNAAPGGGPGGGPGAAPRPIALPDEGEEEPKEPDGGKSEDR